MVMSKKAVVGLASDHFKAWQRSTNKAKILDLWARGDVDDDEYAMPRMPRGQVTEEYQELREVSPTPWGRLVISAAAQTLGVVNHRRSEMGEEESSSTKVYTEAWRFNGMAGKQMALYRGALGQNLSYVTTLPGRRPFTKQPTAVMRGVSATEMAAFYDEEGTDDFARFAMRGKLQRTEDDPEPWVAMEVYDDEAIYYLSCNVDGSEMTYIDHKLHGVEITPVHRFTPMLDLEGRALGEIQPIIPILRRLDQDSFDRLIVQRFNSWKVRYIAGMVKPSSAEEEQAAKMMLKITDLLVSESAETKFGTLDSTDIKQYIEAQDADVKHLSAVTQTPPHHLLGQMANLSAEALTAAETSLMRKVGEYQLSFGQSWDQALRSCAFILGKSGREDASEFLEEALDYSTEIRWRDPSSRSLSQAADALGKIAESLGVPVEMLWEELPFWQKEDTERAKGLLQAQGVDAMLMQFFEDAAGSARNPLREREAVA